mmetsp:Transcript_19793/g.47232  ORF Transcript_19793/g.47232 Transcript_19793/m.47232 type:complete len:271 (+) Transcript_19793:1215-2027(+)
MELGDRRGLHLPGELPAPGGSGARASGGGGVGVPRWGVSGGEGAKASGPSSPPRLCDRPEHRPGGLSPCPWAKGGTECVGRGPTARGRKGRGGQCRADEEASSGGFGGVRCPGRGASPGGRRALRPSRRSAPARRACRAGACGRGARGRLPLAEAASCPRAGRRDSVGRGGRKKRGRREPLHRGAILSVRLIREKENTRQRVGERRRWDTPQGNPLVPKTRGGKRGSGSMDRCGQLARGVHLSCVEVLRDVEVVRQKGPVKRRLLWLASL